jgi:hypothetical protein
MAVGPTRHLQNAVVGEKFHDAVEVVRVEGVADVLEQGDN